MLSMLLGVSGGEMFEVGNVTFQVKVSPTRRRFVEKHPPQALSSEEDGIL